MKVRRVLPTRYGYALRLIWESSPGWSMASFGLLLAQAVLSLAALLLVKWVIDAVTEGYASPDPSGVLPHVAILVGLAAVVAFLSAVCKSVDSAIGEIQRDLIGDHIQGAVHTKAVEADLEYYENAEYFSTLHRAQAEAPSRAATILANLLVVARGGVLLVAIAGLLISFNWWLALAIVAGDIPGALVRLRSAWKLYQWRRERTPEEVQARYYSLLLIARRVAQEMRLFDLGALFIGRFRALRRQIREERKHLAVRRVSAEVAAHVCATAAMYGAYGFVAYQTLAGAITVGDLVMYYAAFQRAQGHLQECLYGLARFYEDGLFLSDLSDYLALEEKVLEPLKPLPVPASLRTGIVFEHVDFRYPGASRPAMENVNLALRPGERIAIVGPNGSGKTTLVKLICRLYDPSAGRITADGIPLPCFSKAAWRREISVLFQDHADYCLTARENISLSDPRSAPDDQEIIAASRGAGADALIRRLPRGYDTVLGSALAHGVELSVGEWQKISLARTFYRDAQILILDEPTASLDAIAEQELLESFWRLAGNRITIVISHRLSTVRMADRIYVLSEGRIVEFGAHDELMSAAGKYADLFTAQAKHYH